MRKTNLVTVPKWSKRDDDKQFLITEMAASQAEKWAWRVFLALKGTTAEVPPETAALGMVGVTIRAVNALLSAEVRWQDVEPLLDEMFSCVRAVKDPGRPDISTPLTELDIEEVETRAWLRAEVLSIHVGFSVAGAFSNLLAGLTQATMPRPPD